MASELPMGFEYIYLLILAKLELELYGLLETLEPPFCLVLLQRGDSKKLLYRILGIGELELLRVVVLVLDIDISRLFIVVVFVLEVVSAAVSSWSRITDAGGTDCSSSDSCMKSSSSDMMVVSYSVRGGGKVL